MAEQWRSRLPAVWNNDVSADTAQATLAAAGYADPGDLLARLERMRASPRYLGLPALSRQRVDALVPQLLATAAEERIPGADPQRVFERLFDLLEAISRRSAYLALLVEHPPVLPRLAQLMGASQWAADYLTRHPILLDELLDARVLLAEPDWTAWRTELARMLAPAAGDAEEQMDLLRHFQHAQSFRLLAQDIAGLLTVERLADHLSALADLILEATVAEVWKQMRGADAPPPSSPSSGTESSAARSWDMPPIWISSSSTRMPTSPRPSVTRGSRGGSSRGSPATRAPDSSTMPISGCGPTALPDSSVRRWPHFGATSASTRGRGSTRR